MEKLQAEGVQMFQLLEEGRVHFDSGQQLNNYSRAVETVSRSEEILANQIPLLKKEIQKAENEGEKLLEILEQVNQRSSEESEKEFQALEENVREKHDEIARIGEDQLETDFEEVKYEFDNQTRRQRMKTAASAAVLGLSGCMYTPDPGESPSKVQNQQSERSPETEREEIVQGFNKGVDNYNKGMKDYNKAGENFRDQNIEMAEEKAEEAAEDFENSEGAFREAATLARKVDNKDAVDLLERGLRKSALIKQAAKLMVETAETYDTEDRSERRRNYNEYRDKVNEANQIKPPSGEKLKEYFGY